MSSASREIALLGGAPVKLFRITRGTVHWFYASTEGKEARDITFLGNTYKAAAISHSNIVSGGDSQQQTITLTLPKDLTVANNWRPYPPGEPISLTIWTWHWNEGDFLVDWIGNLYAPTFDDTMLRLKSDSTAALSKTAGRQRTACRGCDLVVFSQGRGLCNLDTAPHTLGGTLTDVDPVALTVTAAAFATVPDGRLIDGSMEWLREDGIVETRDIVAHAGDTITLAYGALDLAVGLDVKALPGCNGSWEDCEYFDNTDNFGGEPYKPGVSYFSGNLV